MPTEHPTKYVRCGFCAQWYDIGQVLVVGEWTWYPEGERAYWAHSLTEIHQRVLEIRNSSTLEVLRYFETNWERLRQANKDARDPTRRAVGRLLA